MRNSAKVHIFSDTDGQVFLRKTGLYADVFATYAKQWKVKEDHVSQGGEIIQLFGRGNEKVPSARQNNNDLI